MATKHTPVQQEEQVTESYISIGLGLLVVVVVGILIYNYFTQRNNPQTAQDATITEATSSALSDVQPGETYTVQEGDTLWKISEEVYTTGYNWTDIAKANNLTNSDDIETGQTLTIPEVTPILPQGEETAMVAEATPMPTVEPTPAVVAEATPVASSAPVASTAITGSSYTVVHGDTLWKIACQAYGDCYRWSEIATANKLENPNVIHTGNVLTLPGK